MSLFGSAIQGGTGGGGRQAPASQGGFGSALQGNNSNNQQQNNFRGGKPAAQQQQFGQNNRGGRGNRGGGQGNGFGSAAGNNNNNNNNNNNSRGGRNQGNRQANSQTHQALGQQQVQSSGFGSALGGNQQQPQGPANQPRGRGGRFVQQQQHQNQGAQQPTSLFGSAVNGGQQNAGGAFGAQAQGASTFGANAFDQGLQQAAPLAAQQPSGLFGGGMGNQSQQQQNVSNRYQYSMPTKASDQFQILGKVMRPQFGGDQVHQQPFQQQNQQQPPPPQQQINSLNTGVGMLPKINPLQQQQQQQTHQVQQQPMLQQQSQRALPNMLQQPMTTMSQQPQEQTTMPSLAAGNDPQNSPGKAQPMNPNPAGPPQDIAKFCHVSSGAFKVVALTKEQLKQVTLMKQSGVAQNSKCDPIVIQPRDIQFAVNGNGGNSLTPNLNNQSSKFQSPIRTYGFESCAFNSVRRLPDGLGGAGGPRKISMSPDKRTMLSQILVSKYLPTQAECQ